jgi:hypothetical protein
MRIPIACTLTAEAAHDRLDEWRQFFTRSVTAMERTSARNVRFQLSESTSARRDAADLAQREKACCSFFEFSLELEASGWWLVVRVPPDAAPVLAEFASLVPDSLRASVEH